MGHLQVLGPFTWEPGYELLYWVPYVREREGVAVTRGGAGIWYAPRETVDAYDILGFETYSELLRQRGSIKSYSLSDVLDARILRELDAESLLHPSQCLLDVKKPGLDVHYERLPKPPRLDGLPDRYTAVRFYRNGPLKNPQKIWAALERAEHPIVVLKQDRQFDNHSEIDDINEHHHRHNNRHGRENSDGQNLAFQSLIYGPRHSLDTLSRVVAHAEQYICTYGGLSYLGPLYGVPTIAVSDGGKLTAHAAQEDKMIAACGAQFIRTN